MCVCIYIHLQISISIFMCTLSQLCIHPSLDIHIYIHVHTKSLQLCPALCDPVDWSLPGSPVHAILQARILEWLPCPPPGGLPDPRIKSVSLMSLALAGRFFITSTPWEGQFISVSIYLSDMHILGSSPVPFSSLYQGWFKAYEMIITDLTLTFRGLFQVISS